MSRARDLADGTFSGAFAADSPTLVVDAANNRVGVGTSSPSNTLTVNSGAATTTGMFASTGSSAYLGMTNSGATAFIGAESSGAFVVQTPGSAYATKMSIDSAGRVTMPYQPTMHGRLSASTTFNGGDLFKPDAVNVNIGSHYSSATGLFTAPVGGVYQISGTFLVSSSGSSGNALSVFPYYNGAVATSYGSVYASSFSTEISVAGVYLVPLSANDTLGLALTSGGTIRLYGTESFMSIRFLG